MRLNLIKDTLQELVATGLLVSEAQWRQSLGPGASGSVAQVPPPITSLVLASRDRPAVLERAVASYLRNAREFGRVFDLAVIDDSNSGTARRQNRRALSTSRKEYGVRISYAGPQERRSLVEQLAKATGVDRDVLEFGLRGDGHCESAAGAARNTLLLHTIGSQLLLVDDDTVCQATLPPEMTGGLALSSDRDPTEFWFFRNRKASIREVVPAGEDYLGAHEELLGRGVSDCVSAMKEAETLNVDRMDTEMERYLRAHGATIVATSTGIVGDSGIGASAYLFLDSASHRRVCKSEASYRSYVLSRQVLRSVRQATISSGAFCMAGNLGLDNRDILPPFMPVERNSDGIFGLILRTCFPGSYMGYLPRPLLHDPPLGRRHSFPRLWSSLNCLYTSRIVTLLIQSFQAKPIRAEPRETMCRLGGFLSAIGSMPLSDFEELLRVQVWRRFSEQQYHIERSMQSPDVTPPFLAKYLRKYLAVTRAAIVRDEYVVPGPLVKRMGLQQARETSQRRIRLLGEFLREWPQVVETVKQWRAQGKRVGVQLD